MKENILDKQLEFIRTKTDFIPQTAIILGSGLGDLADEIEIENTISYREIPNFPVSTAPHHKGQFVLGKINEKNVIIMQGRVHLYEGYTPQQVVNPVRLVKKMGCGNLLITNASGAVNKDFKPGDFMIISDHISSFVASPLIGENDEKIGLRFPDMSQVYSHKLNSIIEKNAKEMNIAIKKGVYLQLSGPNFETPAEIRMAKAIGADAVGMSTAIEAMAGVHCSLNVCGISVITNLACGISDTPITSEEVKETAMRVAPHFKELIKRCSGEF